MVNRNVSLYSMLLDMWARDLNVEDTLHYCTIMGFSRCVVEPQIKPVFARMDSEYNAVMQKHHDEDHCPIHGDLLGEGDICDYCEALGEALIAEINERIRTRGASLYVTTKEPEKSLRVPVYSFNEAKDLFSILHLPNVKQCRLHYIGKDGLVAVHTFI